MATFEQSWNEHPPSEAIAAELNAERADVCRHGHDPCKLMCGVRKGRGSSVWVVEPYDVRREWFDRMLEQHKREGERHAQRKKTHPHDPWGWG